MVTKIPDSIVAYNFHGLDLQKVSSGDEWMGECPWCGKRRFSVNAEKGKWRCWTCQEGSEKGGGNEETFIQMLWERSKEQTTDDDIKNLLQNRKLLYPATVRAWGLAKSITTGDWLVPGFGTDGKMKTLYRYMRMRDGMRLIPTPLRQHHIHGTNLLREEHGTVFICEGIWDGMSLWETINRMKETGEPDRPFTITSNSKLSIGSGIGVIAVPGCKIFKEEWVEKFRKKNVKILFDNDHPIRNEKTGKLINPAGFAGSMRIAKMLSATENPPASIEYLTWNPDKSKTYNPDLPSGFDVRDFVAKSENPSTSSRTMNPIDDRVKKVETLLGMFREVPSEWIGEENGQPRSKGPHPTIPCGSYKKLITSWRKALKWTDGLDCALSVMLAAVVSTKIVGDQLWVKIIGPASCGKSTLCEAVSTNPRHVVAKSTIRGFHSGYGGEAEEDCSLVVKINGKTLVTKDGDTLLQSPNLGQILAEARDLYDCTARTHYRNKVSRDYAGIRMTWILCGTNSLRSIDSSELGERFLDCVIMERIDSELEDEILWRVANRTDRNMGLESNGKVESQHEPELSDAMQLTGGYIDYLKDETASKLRAVENPDWAKRYCTLLGKYVAFMRARPTMQDESPEREFAARLTSQLLRLSKCLAVVLGKSHVDKEVMRRVRKVADDTSRGVTKTICERLFDNPDGLGNRSLALYSSTSESKIRDLMRFLRMIEVVTLVETKDGRDRRWHLSQPFRSLIEKINQYKGDQSPLFSTPVR